MKKIKNFILFTLIFGYAFECYGKEQKKFIDPHAMFDLSDIKVSFVSKAKVIPCKPL